MILQELKNVVIKTLDKTEVITTNKYIKKMADTIFNTTPE